MTGLGIRPGAGAGPAAGRRTRRSRTSSRPRRSPHRRPTAPHTTPRNALRGSCSRGGGAEQRDGRPHECCWPCQRTTGVGPRSIRSSVVNAAASEAYNEMGCVLVDVARPSGGSPSACAPRAQVQRSSAPGEASSPPVPTSDPARSLSGLLAGSRPQSAVASAVPSREDFGPANAGETGGLVRRFNDYLGLRKVDGTSSISASAAVAALVAVLVLVLVWRLVFSSRSACH